MVIHRGRAIEEEECCEGNPADVFDLVESDTGRFLWGLKTTSLSDLQKAS